MVNELQLCMSKDGIDEQVYYWLDSEFDPLWVFRDDASSDEDVVRTGGTDDESER
jgi:hypothetical protein